ncbi:MAG: cation transporter, partial [Gemmatimonadota bacterium]|nr:cation transporter [Gemmatimonadota bacterium]
MQLRIGGMHCASCVSSVEGALKKVERVQDVSVSLVDELARVTVGGGALEVEELIAAVEKAGYRAEVLEDPKAALESARARDVEREAEARALFRRFWLGVLLGVPVVLVGHWEMIPGLPELSMRSRQGAWRLSALLTVPIILVVGRSFFTGAWAAFRRRTSNMDTLIALGTGSAWLYSTA